MPSSDRVSPSRAYDVLDHACPSRGVLEDIGSRWGALALVALAEGTLRFSELRRRVDGVSEKMLAQALRVLERDGLVERTVFPVVPPHVEYHLTALGESAAAAVAGLVDWLEGHTGAVVAAQEHYDRRDRSAPTAPTAPTARTAPTAPTP